MERWREWKLFKVSEEVSVKAEIQNQVSFRSLNYFILENYSTLPTLDTLFLSAFDIL